MITLKRYLLLLLLTSPCATFAATIHFNIINNMQDEFVWIDQHLATNIISSNFDAKKLPLKTYKPFSWSIVVPGSTVDDFDKQQKFFYELMYRSDTLRVMAKNGAVVGLSQYPASNDIPFGLYDIDSNVVINTDRTEETVNITISRFQSFIGV